MKTLNIIRYTVILLTVMFVWIIMPGKSHAAQFAVVGPRALGMGGASVAAVNDATAVYWNPAALAQFRKLDIRIPAGAALHDHIGLKGTWDEINTIYDKYNAGSATPADLDQLAQLFLELNKPDTGTDIDAHAGLLASIPVGKSAIALSVLGLAYGGMTPAIDTANLGTVGAPPAIVNNNSAVTAISLVSAEPAVSFATSLGSKIFLGANAKMMVAKTYVFSEVISTGDFNNLIDNFKDSETSSNEASLDAGIMFAPTKNFSIGVVGRYLNSPSFPIKGLFAVQDGGGNVTILPGEGEIEIEPQYRAGVAIKPIPLLTVTADYDLSKNATLTQGYEDQILAIGAELSLPREIISFRGGFYKNMADSASNLTYTAGLGIRMFAFRFDLAGAYDFDEREGQVSVDLALRF